MALLRHVKVTLWRAKGVNACTGVLSGLKARTFVTAKASYKNLVYTTNRVEDMGKNPAWDKDGSSVFHFEFSDDPNEFITLELFNRSNGSIGVSKLYFSTLGHLPAGESETKTLPVMVSPNKQSGELIVKAEILEHQVMGDRGLLMVEIQKGMIQKITSIFGSKTTKIKAKLTYKHTTFTTGILEDMGNKFVWHEDNRFTFIINTDVVPDHDTLKVEVYNVNTKVGECEMLMSLFLEEDLRGRSNEFVTHTTDLFQPNKSRAVGNIEVGTGFIPKPALMTRRSSFCRTQHYSPYAHNIGPQVNQFVPFSNPWASVPSPEERLYPPVNNNNNDPSVAQEYTPSAPVMHVPHDRVGIGRAPGYQQQAVGAPGGPSRQDDSDHEEMSRFMASYH